MRDEGLNASMPHMSGEEFARQAESIAAWIARYWESIESMRVRSAATPGQIFDALPASAPDAPERVWETLLRELDATVVPGLTHWQHPSFFGYFPANASGPAVLGELISAGLGVQGMLWSTSPACTEIEMRVMDWLAQAYGLPDAFTHAARLRGENGGEGGGGGVIQSTASEATLVALVAARHRARRDLRDDQPEPHLTLYASSEAHASVVKAAMIAGLARHAGDARHVRRIGVDHDGRMRIAELREAIGEDRAAGRVPCMVVATLGTTGTGAMDDLGGVGEVIREDASAFAGAVPGAWLHVDGAWGVNACVCPEYRGMLRGIERVDSLCVNPHKWLLTNFDCDAFFVRDARAVTDAMSITPEYLRPTAVGQGAVTDFRDWQVPLGRRFRALKLWLVMRHYGLSGLGAFIRESIELAAEFEGWVREDPRFEMHARSLSLVCVRLARRGGESREEADARTMALLERVNASGRAMVTHTRAPGAITSEPGPVVIRVAVGGVMTRRRHCLGLWELLRENA